MKPADSICKIRSFGDSEWFRATCGCLSNNHDRTIVVTKDEDDIISCTIYADLKYYDWSTSNDNFLSKAWGRMKGAWKILTSGYIELQGEFMFDGDQAAKDYANAIIDATTKLKEDK